MSVSVNGVSVIRRIGIVCVCLHTNIILSVAAQRNENTNNNIEIYERYVTGTISVYRAIGRV